MAWKHLDLATLGKRMDTDVIEALYCIGSKGFLCQDSSYSQGSGSAILSSGEPNRAEEDMPEVEQSLHIHHQQHDRELRDLWQELQWGYYPGGRKGGGGRLWNFSRMNLAKSIKLFPVC